MRARACVRVYMFLLPFLVIYPSQMVLKNSNISLKVNYLDLNITNVSVRYVYKSYEGMVSVLQL